MANDAAVATTEMLPDYIRAAKPNPPSNRAPWYKNTAPTYAGVFLWFVFWDQIATNGLSQGGLWAALLGVLIGGLICHFLFYFIPGMMGMKTGLPLYIVGTSTFGAVGGLFMPGFLMGLLQFGWLGVNTYFSCGFLADSLTPPGMDRDLVFAVLCVLFAAGAALVGLKGIQYVAKVATFLPIIPLAVMVLALSKYAGAAAEYKPPASSSGTPELDAVLLMAGQIVGFFATAGAAGVDFGMNNRNKSDVNQGGIWGILIATLVTAGLATVCVAGAHSLKVLPDAKKNDALKQKMEEQKASEAQIQKEQFVQSYTLTNALRAENQLPEGWPKLIMIGLTLAAFPGACFSSFIAANSFKTVMPRINPFISVGVGALVSMTLAITKLAGDLPAVFGIIGASFGPICGAMCVDYLLGGCKWPGPRSGWNLAGWGAWLLGFIVGILPNLHAWNDRIPTVPAAPINAFLIGAIVYYLLAKMGMESKVIPYEPAAQQQA